MAAATTSSTSPAFEPRNTGIPQSKLTPEIFALVLGVYEEVAGIQLRRGAAREADRYFEDAVKSNGDYDLRLGSNIEDHSKLWVEKRSSVGGDRCISFRFDPNYDGPPKLEADLKARIGTFEKAIAKKLTELGVAERLTRY